MTQKQTLKYLLLEAGKTESRGHFPTDSIRLKVKPTPDYNEVWSVAR